MPCSTWTGCGTRGNRRWGTSRDRANLLGERPRFGLPTAARRRFRSEKDGNLRECWAVRVEYPAGSRPIVRVAACESALLRPAKRAPAWER
jgi:hypothetical protein